jgi:hypothetical protein
MSQHIEIPAFLLEMSQQMHQQDNRITAEPIWQVRCKRYLVTQEGYNDHHWEIFYGEDGDYSTLYRSDDGDKSNLAEWLLEHDAQWCKTWLLENDKIESYHDEIESFADVFTQAFIEDFDVDSDHYDLPSSLTKLHFQEIEEVIKSCLTEADANWFIRRKQHDYPHLYTYVASMYLCPQMIELRNWILSLTKAEVAA